MRSVGYGSKLDQSAGSSFGAAGLGAPIANMIAPQIYPQQDYAPQPEVKDRLVIQNSDLSLLVKNVVEARQKIVDYAQSNGGYMVSSSVSNPQDAPTATVVVRVAAAQLSPALDYFHSLAIKVVSENLSGQDVTDQYVDVDARIAQLEKTKAKLQSILDAAKEVSDITSLNQQIITVQSQIDSFKGQQQALQKNAQLAKLTVYLSTDEIALPYAPNETFRPSVIFKLAVRSLISQLRQFATGAIWIAVYAVIWLPVLLIGILVYRKLKLKQNLSQ